MSSLLLRLPVDAALVVFSVGLLLIYVEMNRPGRVIPGAVGLLLGLLACARIETAHPSPVALVLVMTAAVLLAVELVRAMHVAVSVAAALALTLGFRELVTPPVGWMLCIMCGVGLGAVTSALIRVARRARSNKAVSVRPSKLVN